MKSIARLMVASAAAAALSGCVALAVGGAAAGGAVVATDRRDVGIQLEDQKIEGRVERALSDSIPKGQMNIDVTAYNGKVLLTGQVTTAEQRSLAETAASKVENVREVVNELAVGKLATAGDEADDALLAGKVKSELIGTEGVPSGTVLTTVDRNVVYLMGRVTAAEGDAAARAASRVSGVRRVVKLFELVSDQEVAAIRKNQEKSPNSAKN